MQIQLWNKYKVTQNEATKLNKMKILSQDTLNIYLRTRFYEIKCVSMCSNVHVGRVLSSYLSVNSFVMVVYEKIVFFQVQAEFSV